MPFSSDGRFRPEMLQVEINTTCNYRCPMCSLTSLLKDRRPHNMSLEDYKRVVSRDFTGPTMVVFSGFAETLLHPRWGEFARFEKSRGNLVMVATNGALLNEENQQELLDSGVDKVTISFEAMNQATYSRFRVGGDFDRVRENILQFQRRIGDSRKPLGIVLNFVLSRSTAPHVLRFIDTMKAVGLKDLALIRMMDPGGDSEFFREEGFTDEQYRRVDFEAIGNAARRAGVQVFWSDPHPNGHVACPLPSVGIYLSASFDLAVCPYSFFQEGMVFGNLLDHSFAEIWENPAYVRFRNECGAGRFPAFCGAECRCYFTGPKQ